MFREKVIVTKLPVTQAGQIVHFQVKIPRDAARIIGMEVDAQYMNMQLAQAAAKLARAVTYPMASQRTYAALERKGTGRIFTITPDLLLGNVRLQSCEGTNIFYAEDIYFTDENIAFGDFTARTPNFFPNATTHGYKREECVVNTNGESTILKGVYRDRQSTSAQASAIQQGVFFQYVAGIYVWYEIKTDDDDNGTCA